MNDLILNKTIEIIRNCNSIKWISSYHKVIDNKYKLFISYDSFSIKYVNGNKIHKAYLDGGNLVSKELRKREKELREIEINLGLINFLSE